MDLVLLGPDGDVPGLVLDLSVRACGAVFEPGDLQHLQAGDEVEIEFRSLLLLAPMRVSACVRRVGKLNGRSLVALEFLDPAEVFERIPFVLAAEFDRRLAARTVLDEEVVVRVQTLELKDKALLLDLSSGGARLALGIRLAFRIHQGDLLELQFELAGCERPFWVFGSVREVRLAEDQVCCSVKFDAETTVHFADQKARIERFVHEHRRPRAWQQREGAA